jgi:hypothetical protein
MKLKLNKVKILLSAIKLDIFELNYEFSSEKLGSAQTVPVRGYKPKPMYIHFILTFYYVIRSALKHLLMRKKRVDIKDILFFPVGIKHVWALNYVAKKVPKSCIIDPSDGLSEHLPPFKIRLYSLFFIPLVLKKYYYSLGYERKSFHYVFDNYLSIYGNYIVQRSFFQKHRVKAIVVANHYSPICTTVVKAAKDENIKTVYIQHAQVGENFPCLKCDYGLLEGYDALKKYDSCGPSNTEVFLIGMPKMDPFCSSVNKKNNLRKLGICINSLNPIYKVEDLIKKLISDFPVIDIILRPHPGDPDLKKWEEISSKCSLSYSNPLKEEAFAFLAKVDAIIVGDSSIALEAALLNVYPIYYDFAGLYLDYFGYIQNGLIDKHTNNYEDIRKWINELYQRKPDIRQRTKRYCSTVGTIFDGRSCELAAELITDLCVKEKLNSDFWVKIENLNNLEAYTFHV